MARPDGTLTSPPASGPPQADRLGLPARLRLAQLTLAWESFWPGLLSPGLVLGLFLCLVGFDIWGQAPLVLHWLILIGFAAAFGIAGWWGLRHWRWPGTAHAMRRLELENGLAHRPLSHLSDQLAAGQHDPMSEALWLVHRRRLLAGLQDLRQPWPLAGWWRHDRFGLRVAVGLLLVVAWAGHLKDFGQRIEDAVVPGQAQLAAAAITLDAWITPPNYTGRPPIFLGRDGRPVQFADALQVPTGSVLKLRLQGERIESYSARLGASSLPLAVQDGRNGELDAGIALTETGPAPNLVLLRGDRPLATWRLQVLPDLAPRIAFADDPRPVTADRRQPQLEISLTGEDDYGIQKIDVEITAAGSTETWLSEWQAPPAVAGGFSDRRNFDFSEHPLAGLEVSMRLLAVDALEQAGASDAVRVTLPARRFTHPVAKALIEQRRELALRPRESGRVATALRALSLAPEAYRQDSAVHLALRMSAARLSIARGPAAHGEVSALLWQTALRLEDGRSNAAERDFQAAYDRLQDAIEKDVDDPELQQKMQELREAMERVLEEKMREAMERLARGEELEELSEDDEAMDSEDFQDMMDQAEEMMRQGERQSAQEMLEQMQRMLEAMKNMRIGRAPQNGKQGRQSGRQRGGPGGQGQGQELGEMMRQQQQLLDRSFRRSQQGRGDGQQRGEAEADARQQDQLRRRLGEMMNRLAERGQQIPEALGRADRAMRDAREALRRGESGDAMQGQADAMDQLRQGMRDMQQAQRGGEPQGQANAADSRQNQRNRANRDPFGRNTTAEGYEGRDDTQVPGAGQSAVERARRVLEELQRRAGNRERPAQERDYLERLLRRF